MSLASWRAIYYPVPASEATGSDLEAARHSLRKWEGAAPEVLKEHGLERNGLEIMEQHTEFGFIFGSRDCALCERCPTNCDTCSGCIGNRANRERCFSCRTDKDPYSIFRATGDPTPMLAWLRKAVALAEKEAEVKA